MFISLFLFFFLYLLYLIFFLNFFSPYRSERIFLKVTTAFDRVLNPHLMIGVDQLPIAIAIDFSNVRLIDITGNLQYYFYLHYVGLCYHIIIIYLKDKNAY